MYRLLSHTTPSTPELVPILSSGRHRSAKQGACFMEFASYLAGERWSDHPTCTHPLLAALARDVNDLTSDAARDRLMPLVNRVIGLTSDDPELSALIAVRAASAAVPIASLERQRALAAGLLSVLAASGSERLDAIAHDAFDAAPDAERWARHYLATTALPPHPFGRRAAEAIVHTSVVGIALACVEDADDRLRDLLTVAISDAEELAPPIATVIPESVQPESVKATA